MYWEGKFAPHILERGYGYYISDCIKEMNAKDNHIHARVKGNKVYDVHIELEGDDIKNMTCSCPYADRTHYCKHQAAVLYEWFNNQFVLDVLENKKEDVIKYKTMIEDLIFEYTYDSYYDDEDDYDCYGENDILYEKMIELFEEQFNKLVEDGLYYEIYKLVLFALYKVEIVWPDINCSSDGFEEFAENCVSFMKGVISRADETHKEKIFYHLMNCMYDDYKYQFIYNYIEDMFFLGFTEDKYLEKIIAFINEHKPFLIDFPDTFKGERYKEKWADKYVDILKKLKK